MKKSKAKATKKAEDKDATIIDLLNKDIKKIIELLKVTLAPAELITACKNKNFLDGKKMNRVAFDYDDNGNN